MIQVINRAFNILELIAKDKGKEHSLREIADNLNLNPSTCANIIKTLVNRGYLEQQGKKRGYKLGSQAYYLTGNYSNKRELLKVSTPLLQRLRDVLNESCILAVLKENMRVTLHKELSSQELQVISDNEEKNIYQTATGRVILACFNETKRMQFIKKFGLPNSMWIGVNNEKELIKELDKIREKQLAVHFDGAYTIGVGAPIYKNSKVVAAIGVYLPKMRFNHTIQKMIFNEISKTAQLISKKMTELNQKND